MDATTPSGLTYEEFAALLDLYEARKADPTLACLAAGRRLKQFYYFNPVVYTAYYERWAHEEPLH